jgi:hypothetical protein
MTRRWAFDGLTQSSGARTLTGKGPHPFSDLTTLQVSGMDGWHLANPGGSRSSPGFRSEDGSLAEGAGHGVVNTLSFLWGPGNPINDASTAGDGTRLHHAKPGRQRDRAERQPGRKAACYCSLQRTQAGPPGFRFFKVDRITPG